jgi:hypothetical protein
MRKKIGMGTGGFHGLCALAALWMMVQPVAGQNSNGNDLALSLAEAAGDAERLALLADAGRRPHLFRYLQIVDMQETGSEGRRAVRITALEPASARDVVFTVNQKVSLSKLSDEPASVPGRALAVSGVIARVDAKTGAIFLDPAVIRYKDRPAPAVGKEMLYELDERGTFYSFNGGREAVALSFRDRDLLQHRDRIMAAGGDQAWADFLQREIRRREAERQAGGVRP